jgi:hypothetical protein
MVSCPLVCREQDADGFIGDTAPLTFGGRPSDPSWGAAFPSLTFYLYRYHSRPTLNIPTLHIIC